MSVFVLQHSHTNEWDDDDVKMIGVYSSRLEAERAVERIRTQPGFVDYPRIVDPRKDEDPNGFYIDEFELDQDEWREGFVSAIQATMPATIDELIATLVNGSSGSNFEAAARRFDALPLHEGWDGWALLTRQGEVFDADEAGALTLAKEPLRTMYLVGGAERYPELAPLLPVRPSASRNCLHCDGTGWMPLGEDGRIRCSTCRALGWVDPSNHSQVT